jgi:hypothetical protein
MKKLLSKTTVWKYEDKTIIHCKTKLDNPPIFFSNGSANPFEWDNGGYVDLNKMPKTKFITRFKKRLYKPFQDLTEMIGVSKRNKV